MTGVVFALAMIVAPAALQDQGQGQSALPPVATVPAQESPAPVKLGSAPVTAADRQAFRDNISNMEGLLASAVANGARKIQADNPTVTLVATVNPRARGFVLDGYGLFFDVEIPELTGSVELSLTLMLQRELQKRLDDPANGARRTSQQSMTAADDMDPSAPYREAVISSVTNAMLAYKSLEIQPNEWLTVALRGSELPNIQVGIRDSRTVILRLKGSDLADYLASRISKEEAIKRVEKREF